MRLALIGDIHLRFDRDDAALLDAAGYDAILFAGDLSGYAPKGGLEVARAIATLRTPAIVVPGNHDCMRLRQLLAELIEHPVAVDLASGGERQRVAALQAALAPAALGGYSLHPLGHSADRIDCVVARPHSFGGPRLSYRPYLREAFGIDTLEDSARHLCALVDRSETERIVFLGHNGPSGLGARRNDIWGADFRPSEGDHGDPDLRVAIDHARARGKQVVAVLAGHMHHALRGGGRRTWLVREGGTLYVNAARVPRSFRERGEIVRHHVEITIEGAHAEAREVLARTPG